jgi:predicted phage terminase large subunit-like protein
MRLIWPVLNPGGELVYVCTRWDWADMAQDILNEKEKDPSSWDTPIDRGFFSCYAKPGDEEVFPHAVPGEPLFPSILPHEELEQLKRTMNLYHFSCQYKNDPIPSEFQFFKQADFQYTIDYDSNHDSFKDLTFYIGVDPAGGTDTVKRGDDTAIVVIGVRGQRSNRQIYVVECQGGQWKPSQTNETLQLLYEKWRPRRIGIETSGVGKMFWAQLHDWMRSNLVHLPLKELKRGGSRESKADRISALEPLYRSHSIFHVPQIKGSILEEQLLRFKPGGNVHDDYPDALTMAVETIREGLQKRSGSIFGLHQKPRYPRMGM